MKVYLSSVGNPDFRGQDADTPISPAGSAFVTCLTEAEQICERYITRYDLGGGNWSGGQLIDDKGMEIGVINYNGTFTRHDKPRPDIRVPITDKKEAREFIKALCKAGMSFHLDDDPVTIYKGASNEMLFTRSEAAIMRERVSELFEHLKDPFPPLVRYSNRYE